MIKDSENPLTIPDIKSYMLMLLRGVTHLHSHNIMHRDIKPANLLISAECRLKIADFGLSRVNQAGAGEARRQYSHQVESRKPYNNLPGRSLHNHNVTLTMRGIILD